MTWNTDMSKAPRGYITQAKTPRGKVYDKFNSQAVLGCKDGYVKETRWYPAGTNEGGKTGRWHWYPVGAELDAWQPMPEPYVKETH